MQQQKPKAMSVRDAAKMLGCTRKYLFDLLYEGRLPGAQKIGRQWQIPIHSVEARLKAREK
jgi:excisionase family DNA binding protein